MPPKQKAPIVNQETVKKYYAVRIGRHPGIYITWPEAQKEVSGFAGAVYKSFPTLAEAQEYMHTAVGKLRGDKDSKKPTISDLNELMAADLTTIGMDNNPQTDADMFIPHLQTRPGDDKTAFLRSTPDEWTYHQGEFYLATDGSFNTKSRRSGWAVYLGREASNIIQEMPRDTTNNRCELLAIQAALGCVLAHLGHPRLTSTDSQPVQVPVINIVTDSQLCVSTFTKWITGWKKKGWRLASGEEPKNLSEVQEIDRQLALIRGRGIRVEFIHQRAHTSGAVAGSKAKTQKERILWQINYVVDALAQQLTN